MLALTNLSVLPLLGLICVLYIKGHWGERGDGQRFVKRSCSNISAAISSVGSCLFQRESQAGIRHGFCRLVLASGVDILFQIFLALL